MTALAQLFKKGKIVKFKKNDFFISPRILPQGIYHITDGFVYSYSQSASHKKRIQTIFKKGDIFPLTRTIDSSNARNDMYIQALTDGAVQVIDKKDFLDFINNSHEAALEFISVLLLYIRVYVDRVENLEEDTVRTKLINRLLFFASKFGITEDKHIFIDLPITHKLIAESISVSRENVTRELKSLEKNKLITIKNRRLIILDLQKLKEEL